VCDVDRRPAPQYYNKGRLLDDAWVKAQRLFHAGELKGVSQVRG